MTCFVPCQHRVVLFKHEETGRSGSDHCAMANGAAVVPAARSNLNQNLARHQVQDLSRNCGIVAPNAPRHKASATPLVGSSVCWWVFGQGCWAHPPPPFSSALQLTNQTLTYLSLRNNDITKVPLPHACNLTTHHPFSNNPPYSDHHHCPHVDRCLYVQDCPEGEGWALMPVASHSVLLKLTIREICIPKNCNLYHQFLQWNGTAFL